MHRNCLRHELAMLRMVGTSITGAAGADAQTEQHARVLREIHRCPRCRHRRGEGDPMTLVVTLTCADGADVGEVVTAVAEVLPARLPDSVEAVTVKVA